ncbi:hypothetical protein VaNZ11_013160 [Volvox africanus]|uniref:Uncharacterized protein n=1 Tax=Volvox africanus TaxID=51714 RepID=A0ABQ5SGZ9_9CHLO|nr:hypothetical protein VaNZ11_013160 [Volvox africanus]
MANATEVNRTSGTALPGLEHLRDSVHNWEASVRTLSLTAAAMAESVGAGMAAQTLASYGQQPERTLKPDLPPVLSPFPPFPSAAPVAPAAALPGASSSLLASSPIPTLVVSGSQLKAGRVFIVANLQGAYYTLLEFLSRQKFDFRSDNLLHLGNLVAPPTEAVATVAASGFGGGSKGSPETPGPSRRRRNSTSVLKLVRRHGGLGPMGGHECLALLVTARANRMLAFNQAEEERRLAALLSQKQQQEAEAGAMVGFKKPSSSLNVRCSALSLQLAGVTATGAGAPTPPAWCTSAATPVNNWLGPDCSSQSDSSDGASASDDEMDVDVVAASWTPHRDGSMLSPSAPATATAGCSTMMLPGGAASGLSLDKLDLSQMLSMPACVVLEPYGVRLQHAGPTDAADVAPDAATAGNRRYHTLFSHRRAGGGATVAAAGGGVNAHFTGISSSRDVVRFAVLPPLRTLQRLSPGFGAKMAALVAPSREDLMLEILEEPVSELDA